MTLTVAYAHPIEEKVREEFKADQDRKHSQKINRTNALASMRGCLTNLFLKKIIDRAIIAFDKIVYKKEKLLDQIEVSQEIIKSKKNVIKIIDHYEVP